MLKKKKKKRVEKKENVRGTRVNVSKSRANREERCRRIITAVIHRFLQVTRRWAERRPGSPGAEPAAQDPGC